VRLFLGVDPGLSGGIAAVWEDGQLHQANKMPVTDADLFALFVALVEGAQAGRARAVLERVGAWPGMGCVSAFTFGRGVGALQMALHAAGVPFDLVMPNKWQKEMGCLSGRDKNVTKRRAQQLFPTMRVTHALSDALLLAEYCRRRECGIIAQESRRQQIA
jgi:hypothetical protein